MSKLGRNDPCHCGSGKKYKKCCADADAQVSLTPDMQLKEATKAFLSDVSHRANKEQQDFAFEGEDNEDEPYPAISAEEEKLVDEWWDVYRKVVSIDEIKRHLDNFIGKYPHLVENVGLEHEVLFELGAEYRRQERTDEYISFLMDFRNRFPATYTRSAGYYDLDIIAWLISKRRTGEIKAYLNYFIENPIRFVDQLYETIYLLLATDTTEEVIPLILQVAERVIESDELIYTNDIVHPLLIHTLSLHIKEGFSEQDVQQFVNELHRILPYEITEDKNIIDVWLKKFQAIARPFDPWPETVPSTRLAQSILCSEIKFNFMRYIHETLNISWMSAQYYADLLDEYLMAHLENVKGKNRRLFDFSRKNIEKQLNYLTREMYFYLNCTRYISLLNTIYFFGAYLCKCNHFTKEEMNAVQENCVGIYYKVYAQLKKEYTEALCFEEFPMKQMGSSCA